MTRYLGVLVVILAVLGGGPASAAEIAWTMRLTVEQAASTTADAQAQRNVGVVAIAGPAEIAGETAKASVMVLYDYANGTGPWQSYMTVTFDDGSILTTYGNGLTVADAEGRNSHFDGSLIVVSGTGRFEGTRGTGTMAGARVEQLGDAVQIDYTITLRLDD